MVKDKKECNIHMNFQNLQSPLCVKEIIIRQVQIKRARLLRIDIKRLQLLHISNAIFVKLLVSWLRFTGDILLRVTLNKSSINQK